MKKILFLQALLAISLGLQAQKVLSAAGGQSTAGGVTLAWTLGEPATATLSGGSNILTQGFHQSRLSSTAVDDILIPGLSLSVFPNPAAYELNLQVKEGEPATLKYALLSMEGKVLQSQKIAGSLTAIDLEKRNAGTYLLRVSKTDGKPVQTFKIIKN